MTSSPELNWATLSISLFNTILLTWLGLTILLNAGRRTTGLWIATGALLMGAAFFLSHSAIVGYGPLFFSPGMDFWWHAGWIPVVALPVAWYAVMLWYNGYWEQPTAPRLQVRHALGFTLACLLAVGLLSNLLLYNPLPSVAQLGRLDIGGYDTYIQTPMVILLYPFYTLMCTGLSLDLIRRPAPTGQAMGDLARRRARPWLAATSIALFIVSLLVGAAVFWAIGAARRGVFSADIPLTVAIFDLVIAGLIAVCILLVGQAVVSYEIFTGQTLPRRGLRNYWRNAILLAGGYAAIASWGLVNSLQPIYNLLISALIVTIFYALVSWGSFAEREHFMASLRPFVASQRLYERLLRRDNHSVPFAMEAESSTINDEPDIQRTFQALCQDVLGARLAFLVPLGQLAPLAGAPIAYPADQAYPASLAETAQLAAQLSSQPTVCAPIDPQRFGGAHWAVPLWGEQRQAGPVGLLLLGERRGGSLYTQEEIELASAAGERMVDTQAGLELARRLVLLQRQRLAESQVLDQHTRRTLHDDILPQLHATLLDLSALGQPQATAALRSLAEIHSKLSHLLRELPGPGLSELQQYGLVGALRQVGEGELKEHFERLEWQVDAQAESHARNLPGLAAEVVYYAAREAMRNAARHARPTEQSRPSLSVLVEWQAGLHITIADNGPGLPVEASPTRGSGQGLALHSALLAVLGGSLSIDSAPGLSTRVHLFLPEMN